MCTLTIWSSVVCVLIVEFMSVVVNEMLSIIECDELTPCFVQPISAHGCHVLWEFFYLWVSLVPWILMISACVSWISSLSSSSLFLIPLMLTSSMMIFFLLLGLCPCVVCVVMRSSLYPVLWMRWLSWLCVRCVCWESARVPAMLGRGRHNLHSGLESPPRVGCVVWRHIIKVLYYIRWPLMNAIPPITF